MRTALLDSDVIAYRASILTENEPLGIAIELARSMTQVWTSVSECDGYVHCVSTSPSFRTQVWSDYKKNRKTKERPRHLSGVYEAIMEDSACWHSTFEGDDILGILGTFPKPVDDMVIVTIDKDLDQIPGLHCNPDKEILYKVSTDDADRYRWQQVLSGDTSDNYPGIPGVGLKKAERIIEYASEGSREDVVRLVYESKELGHTFDAMVKCATILTYKQGVLCEQSLQDSTEVGTLRGFLQSLRQYSM